MTTNATPAAAVGGDPPGNNAGAKTYRWGPEDDIKLLRLFRQKRNGVNPLMKDSAEIEALRLEKWPMIKEKTFANRFREKARDFCVSCSQDGHRRSKLRMPLSMNFFLILLLIVRCF